MRRIFILEQRMVGRWSHPTCIVEPTTEDKRLVHNVDDPQLIKSINQDAALSGKNLTDYLMRKFDLGKDEKYWFVWDGRLYSSFEGQRVRI